MSRTINKAFLLGPREKQKFQTIMRKVEAFSGCTVLTYAIMDNHFHILLAENSQKKLTDSQFLERCRALYEGRALRELENEFNQCLRNENRNTIERFKQKYTARMHNVSQFMHTLLTRFSQWFNRTHDRIGPMWCSRFKSILVEGKDQVLYLMAAYIDLNPVRANLVDDPVTYPWCGIGEAAAGSPAAREGLLQLFNTNLGLQHNHPARPRWKEVIAMYRLHLADKGLETKDHAGQIIKNGLSQEAIQKILDSDGTIPLATALRCRLKFLSNGIIIGSQAFLESNRNAWQPKLRLKRPRNPIPLHHIDQPDLHTARPWDPRSLIA